MPYSIFLTLTFYIFSYHFNRCTICGKQTKTLTPKMFFPKLLTYLRKFFLQKSTARTFVCVYEFAYLCIRMCFEENMYMIFIVVPSCNVILYFGDMYSNISFALSDMRSSNTFLQYFTTSTR